MKLHIVMGDITDTKADILVNSANPALRRGGGVCGAFYNACNDTEMMAQELRERAPFGLHPGEFVLTGNYGLHCDFIAHAVGPKHNTPAKHLVLGGLYADLFDECYERGFRSIAFPSISTGIYKYPVQQAANRLMRAVIVAASVYKDRPILDATLVCNDNATYDAYVTERALWEQANAEG